MKILIAEDDPTSALVLRKALEKQGHEALVTADGAVAWEAVKADSDGDYPLIISDWMMPGIDGLELTRRIRGDQQPGQHYRYVILLTARGRAEDRREGLAAGADDFMVKPLDMGDLVARLEVAQRIMALQRNVQSRGEQFERLQMHLEKAAPMGEILIAQGSITPSQLRQALDQQMHSGKKLGAILIDNRWATEEDITRARSVQFDVPFVDVAEEEPDPQLIALVSEEAARKHQMLVLSQREGGNGLLGVETVRVAVANPWNIEGIDLVQSLARRRVEPLLAGEEALKRAIERAYRGVGAGRITETLMEGAAPEDSRTRSAEDFDTSSAGVEGEAEQAPVIRLLNTVLTDAIRRRASDIHVEPYKNDFEIRYRIDGELHVIHTLPRQFLANLISRVKIMGEMDIAERRVPQDGRISIKVDGRGIDLRVSTLPNQFGERVVLRVLDRSNAERSLDDLNFSQRNRTAWDGLIRRPHGIILVTGPTGSGKTTTLYSSLNALKSTTVNIMTCEDPIEYELDRISQSNVNEKAGLTFARQLRAILRQDPDVVLVGEIRDAETAETAFRAALTGHLVLSTLHCNEAAGAPTRLIDMGVQPFLIASALIGVVAQRLVRRLCPECREPYEPDSVQYDLLDAMNEGRPLDVPHLYRAKGCRACDNLGYRGRVGVHEVLLVDEKQQQLIMRSAETKTMRSTALESGMIPMVGDGLEKAVTGLTTIEEVHKRIGGETISAPPPRPLLALPPVPRLVTSVPSNGDGGENGVGVAMRPFLPKLDDIDGAL